MTEEELRTLVREAIARQRGETAGLTPAPPFNVHPPSRHSSHGMFVLASGADGDGPCIIEPTVACNHCGYCRSMGH